MLRQIIRLWSVSACNLFGINELRHTRDAGRRRKAAAVAVIMVLLVVMFEGYLVANISAYLMMGMGEIVPMYCYTLSGLLVLFFTLLKAGSIIFQKSGFEMLMALPVRRSAIVMSRFFYMYTTNLLFAALVMLPGMVLFGLWRGMGIGGWLISLISTLFAPLLPMTIATAVSVILKGISSRMKYKSLTESILMVGFTLAILFGTSSREFLQFSEDFLQNLAALVEEKISKLYPPAVWFGRAILEGDLFSFLLLVGSAAVLFGLLVFLMDRCFMGIYTALNASRARRDFEKVTGRQSSVLCTLIRRELRYYVSCSIYLSNTIMGPVMMVAAAVGACLAGQEAIEKVIPLEHVVTKALPFLLALCGILMPTTAASVSLEGKQRWITRSLPIPEKTQYDAKLLMFLLVSAPFYLASVLIAAIGLKITGLDLLWLILVPAVYLIFGGILGLTANLLFPVFDWQNEVSVVKQSMAVLVSMLASMLCVLIPGGLYVMLAGQQGWLLMLGILLLIGGCSVLLYRRNLTLRVHSD